VDDDAIRALVARLSRAHPSGGTVIERAAILAEGADFDAVMQWIVAHGGQPEATVVKPSTSGLHGQRIRDSEGPDRRTPSRFVLPEDAYQRGGDVVPGHPPIEDPDGDAS
jgi:hypothetical protein